MLARYMLSSCVCLVFIHIPIPFPLVIPVPSHANSRTTTASTNNYVHVPTKRKDNMIIIKIIIVNNNNGSISNTIFNRYIGQMGNFHFLPFLSSHSHSHGTGVAITILMEFPWSLGPIWIPNIHLSLVYTLSMFAFRLSTLPLFKGRECQT